MPLTVSVLRKARADVVEIYVWLAKRSEQGADRWYEAYLDAISRLETDAHMHAKAMESRKLKIDLRESYFKTASGNRYRLLFLITQNEVQVLRVRAPGRRLVTKRDIRT